MKAFILALAVQPILFLIATILISAGYYIAQELLHSFKNAKRSAREFLWRVEWELNH